MRYLLALLVFVLGLEGLDRALLGRAMDSMKPPREPKAFHALLKGSLIPEPPPPPPPPIPIPPGDWMFN